MLPTGREHEGVLGHRGAGTVGVSGGEANTARCHRELHEYLSHLCYKFELM